MPHTVLLYLPDRFNHDLHKGIAAVQKDRVAVTHPPLCQGADETAQNPHTACRPSASLSDSLENKV